MLSGSMDGVLIIMETTIPPRMRKMLRHVNRINLKSCFFFFFYFFFFLRFVICSSLCFCSVSIGVLPDALWECSSFLDDLLFSNDVKRLGLDSERLSNRVLPVLGSVERLDSSLTTEEFCTDSRPASLAVGSDLFRPLSKSLLSLSNFAKKSSISFCLSLLSKSSVNIITRFIVNVINPQYIIA